MKKYWIYILTLIMATACFSSCSSLIHRHIVDEKWSYNELMHWHNVTCTWDMCKFDLVTEEHIDEGFDGICDVCGYTEMGAICP